MSIELVSMERRTEVLNKAMDLSDKLAEFITQHYCPKTMKSDLSDIFYLLLASTIIGGKRQKNDRVNWDQAY